MDVKSSMFQKLMQNPKIMKMAEQMFNSMGQQGQANFLGRPNIAQAMKIGVDGGMGVDGILQQENPGASIAQALAGGGGGSPGGPGDLGSLALGAAKAHPFKAAGLLGLGAGNIGGLMDNDKFGGQLGGLALGGLGSAVAGVSPYTAAMLTMGGGGLGALFDKLRAQKEAQGAMPQQRQSPYQQFQR